jgi:hypothetical protein
MNCSCQEFFQIVQDLPDNLQYYVTNTTHRLAEADWIARKLEEDVRAAKPPVGQEGLLSLQIYLLLTCADALGHAYCAGGVRARFWGFFRNLPPDARENLTDSLLTWKTGPAELATLGLANAAGQTAVYPSREQVARFPRAS